MKRLLLLLLVCACKTSSESEQHLLASVADTHSLDQHVAEQHVTTAVVERHIVRRWKLPPATQATDDGPDPFDPFPRPLPDVEPEPHDEYTEEVFEKLAPVDTTSTDTTNKAQDTKDAKVDKDSEQKSSRDFLHSPFAWIGALVTLGGVGLGVWKLRKAVPL